MKLKRENLENCPICGGQLYAYSLMGIMSYQNCYCPNCDISREHYMSIPILCSECYSRDFYEKEEKYYCWFCGSHKIKKFKIEEFEKQKLNEKEGYKLSLERVELKNNNCKHSHVENIRHNEEKFKFTCKDCGYIEYVFIPIWKQEELKIKDHIDVGCIN